MKDLINKMAIISRSEEVFIRILAGENIGIPDESKDGLMYYRIIKETEQNLEQATPELKKVILMRKHREGFKKMYDGDEVDIEFTPELTEAYELFEAVEKQVVKEREEQLKKLREMPIKRRHYQTRLDDASGGEEELRFCLYCGEWFREKAEYGDRWIGCSKGCNSGKGYAFLEYGGLDKFEMAMGTVQNRLDEISNRTLGGLKNVRIEDIKEDADNKNLIIEVKEYLDNPEESIKNARSFCLYGKNGQGKSYILAALHNGLREQGFLSVFVGVGQFFTNRSGFDVMYRRQHSLLYLADFLVLDDITKIKPTDWAYAQLFSVIDYRYNAGLPICITCNNTVDGVYDLQKDLIEHFNDRSLTDRLLRIDEGKRAKAEGKQPPVSVFHFKGKSYR